MDSSDESKLPEEKRTKAELANAFPLAIRQDALVAISALSENRFSSRWQTFSLHLGHELLALPQRIYYVPPVLQTLRLNTLQMEILGCLFTRHHDGFVRQTHLGKSFVREMRGYRALFSRWWVNMWLKFFRSFVKT